MLALHPAQVRDVESLQNWLDGNGCLAEEESAYLAHRGELVSLAPAGDNAILQLEAWVEQGLVRLWRNFRKVFQPHYSAINIRTRLMTASQGRFHDVSDDPNVYIYSGSLIQLSARALLLLLITFLLLMPVVICNIIGTISIRIFIVIMCTMMYLLVLSALTKSRTMELILAGAT
jgi:hypothetical protein